MIFKVILGKEIHIIKSNDKPTLAELKKFLPNYFKKLPQKYILSYLDQDSDEIVLNDQYDYEILLGSSIKTAKINIKENNEDFMQLTQRIELVDLASQSQLLIPEVKEVQQVQEPIIEDKKEISSIQEKAEYSMTIDDSFIEQKLRKMMPEIISKIKSEISSEALEKSKISEASFSLEKNNEPTIVQDNSAPYKKVKRQDQTLKVLHRYVNCDGCGRKGLEGIRYKCSVCDDFDFCEQCEATVEHDHPFLKIKNPKQAPKKIFVVLDQENEQKESSFSCNGNQIPIPQGLDNIIHQGMNLFRGFLQGQHSQELKKKFNAVKEEWKKGNNPMKNCGMFRNCQRNRRCQESEPRCEQKEEKVETKEFVPEVKVEAPEVKRELISQEPKMKEIPQEYILTNANYLVQVFDIQLQKAVEWAQQYPYFSKEELLNFCINSPSFFN